MCSFVSGSFQVTVPVPIHLYSPYIEFQNLNLQDLVVSRLGSNGNQVSE